MAAFMMLIRSWYDLGRAIMMHTRDAGRRRIHWHFPQETRISIVMFLVTPSTGLIQWGLDLSTTSSTNITGRSLSLPTCSCTKCPSSCPYLRSHYPKPKYRQPQHHLPQEAKQPVW